MLDMNRVLADARTLRGRIDALLCDSEESHEIDTGEAIELLNDIRDAFSDQLDHAGRT